MNDDFEDIQRLIRLKRHESPGEGFTEEFLKRFHQRQREETLRKSSIDLFWERLTDRFESLMTPRWALAGATALLTLFGAWFYTSGAMTSPAGIATKSEQGPAGPPDEKGDTGDPKRPKHGTNALPASHSTQPEDLPDEDEQKAKPQK